LRVGGIKLVYVDADGKTAQDYKDDINNDLDFNPGLKTYKNDFDALWQKWKAGWDGMKYEYKFTFAEEQPDDRKCIALRWPVIMETFEGVVDGLLASMKFLNKAITLPSDLVAFTGTSVSWDWNVDEEPYQEKKMLYIVDFQYRLRNTTDSWTEGAFTRFHSASGVNLNQAYDTGSYLIWNCKNESEEVNEILGMTITSALGQEINGDFGDAEGFKNTIDWKFKTSEEPPRYLPGTHAYWKTHGFPNGRKYRFVEDGVKRDGVTLGIVVVIGFAIKKLGLGKLIKSVVQKALTKRLAGHKFADSVSDIMDLINGDVTKGKSGMSFNEIYKEVRKAGKRYW
jgi:hypothetical protein